MNTTGRFQYPIWKDREVPTRSCTRLLCLNSRTLLIVPKTRLHPTSNTQRRTANRSRLVETLWYGTSKKRMASRQYLSPGRLNLAALRHMSSTSRRTICVERYAPSAALIDMVSRSIGSRITASYLGAIDTSTGDANSRSSSSSVSLRHTQHTTREYARVFERKAQPSPSRLSLSLSLGLRRDARGVSLSTERERRGLLTRGAGGRALRQEHERERERESPVRAGRASGGGCRPFFSNVRGAASPAARRVWRRAFSSRSPRRRTAVRSGRASPRRSRRTPQTSGLRPTTVSYSATTVRFQSD